MIPTGRALICSSYKTKVIKEQYIFELISYEKHEL